MVLGDSRECQGRFIGSQGRFSESHLPLWLVQGVSDNLSGISTGPIGFQAVIWELMGVHASLRIVLGDFRGFQVVSGVLHGSQRISRGIPGASGTLQWVSGGSVKGPQGRTKRCTGHFKGSQGFTEGTLYSQGRLTVVWPAIKTHVECRKGTRVLTNFK